MPSALREAGIDLRFVQDNHSYSAAAGVLRGLHYQLAAARPGQAGARDPRRDLRRRGRHPPRLADLRPLGRRSICRPRSGTSCSVPKGFAHGFVTLEPDTEVLYKVTAPIRPSMTGRSASTIPTSASNGRSMPSGFSFRTRTARRRRLPRGRVAWSVQLRMRRAA